MAGMPGVERINLEAAPPAFVKMLFGPSAPPQDPPAPARSLAQLLDSLEAYRHLPVVTLRQALLQVGPLDARTLDALAAHEPDLLRSGHAGLVTRVLLTADELGHALARTAGLPEVDAAQFDIPSEAFRRLPLDTARGHQVLPLGMAQEIFFIASATPTHEDLRHALCSVTGCNVILVWADSQSIQDRLDVQERLVSGEPIAPPTLPWTPPFVVRTPEMPDAPMEQLVSQAVLEVDAGAEQERSAFSRDDSGMARMVRKMILDAQKSGASDIHVEAHADEAMTIRFRRDGDLEPYLQMPARLRAPLVSRIKIMARLDIAEHRRPQDGKINFADFGGEQLELRVAIMPTHDGLENVVLRLLSSAKPIPLASLGLQPRDEEAIARLSERSFGLVLAAGPTGSGKTTTLHSMLAEINTDERKIWTAEDPIEITQPGLNQVQVNARIGLTFAAAMRGFLRADPDVIMIGEIRDEETAKVAIEASLTGHLVLSTLHTNNASESVVRLLDIGMDPMNFADSLVGIVAQRLVRALCPHCAQRRPLDAAGCAQLVADYREQTRLSEDEAGSRLMQAAGVASLAQLTVGTAAGCPHCKGKGYKGRIGIYEILQNNPALRTLIQQRARPAEVFDAAIASGMHSLRHDALEKVVQGRIDLRQARAAYL
ncbi:MAG: type II/IV secretion system protein [Comamonadaceae bacterium]|nr:MAG: type II/IV secretion system protein [Comamonadaceae bacterium]